VFAAILARRFVAIVDIGSIHGRHLDPRLSKACTDTNI
jgi:hypothetical protein